MSRIFILAYTDLSLRDKDVWPVDHLLHPHKLCNTKGSKNQIELHYIWCRGSREVDQEWKMSGINKANKKYCTRSFALKCRAGLKHLLANANSNIYTIKDGSQVAENADATGKLDIHL